MGCDIHLFAEKRVGDSWVTADTWAPDKYEPGHLSSPYEKRFYNGRNYDLFSMLADVRNGYGFAGVPTGEGFNPISPPKGLPDDCCPEVRAESARWGGDGHSHSYLTVAELMAYDWLQTTTKTGWVDPIEWARFHDRGRPESWSGGVSGGAVRHVAPEIFEKAWQTLRTRRGYPEQRRASAYLDPGSDVLREFIALAGGGMPYCRVQWQIEYLDSASEFLGSTLPRLWRLGSANDVRIVFWFDN